MCLFWLRLKVLGSLSEWLLAATTGHNDKPRRDASPIPKVSYCTCSWYRGTIYTSASSGEKKRTIEVPVVGGRLVGRQAGWISSDFCIRLAWPHLHFVQTLLCAEQQFIENSGIKITSPKRYEIIFMLKTALYLCQLFIPLKFSPVKSSPR